MLRGRNGNAGDRSILWIRKVYHWVMWIGDYFIFKRFFPGLEKFTWDFSHQRFMVFFGFRYAHHENLVGMSSCTAGPRLTDGNCIERMLLCWKGGKYHALYTSVLLHSWVFSDSVTRVSTIILPSDVDPRIE